MHINFLHSSKTYVLVPANQNSTAEHLRSSHLYTLYMASPHSPIIGVWFLVVAQNALSFIELWRALTPCARVCRYPAMMRPLCLDTQNCPSIRSQDKQQSRAVRWSLCVGGTGWSFNLPKKDKKVLILKNLICETVWMTTEYLAVTCQVSCVTLGWNRFSKSRPGWPGGWGSLGCEKSY